MYKRLLNFIKKHDTITIFSHIFPDGDAIGSLIGLKELIKTNFPHKQVFCIGANNAPFTSIVGYTDTVDDTIIHESGALIIDVANGARVEDQRFLLAKDSFKLDHHIFAEKFTNDEIVKNDRIATAEIIGEFMLLDDLTISSRGATALAMGIITDSGRFMYDLTSATTFDVMSLLLRKGADLKLINDALSERKIDGLKTRGYFLSNYELFENMIYIVVDYKTLCSLDVLPNEGGKFVNLYGSIENYPIWLTFFEDKDGSVYVEFRSKKYNVQKIATQFGGGGHLKASGCKLINRDEISTVLDALKKAEELV